MTTKTCPRCDGSGYVLWVQESVEGEPGRLRLVPKPTPAPDPERRPPKDLGVCTACQGGGKVRE